MDICILKDFLTLIQYRNFSLAADASNISQSALSKQIRNLEHEIGDIVLVDRSKRPLELTAAGEEFLQHARAIMLDYDNMMAAMKAFRSEISSVLRIGIYPALSDLGLMSVVDSFARSHMEGGKLEIVDRQSSELKKMLLDGMVDVAFLTNAPKHSSIRNLSVRVLKRCNLCLAVNINNPISSRKTIDFRELANQNILVVDSSEAIYNISMDECKAGGISPNIMLFHYVNTMIDMISANKGVGLISYELSKKNRASDIVFLPFEKPLYYNVSVACSKNALSDRRIREFIGYTEAQFKKKS